TAVDAVNVRGFDPKTDRARGSSRTGTSKFMEDFAVALNSPIQYMASVVTTDIEDIALSKVDYSLYVPTATTGVGVLDAAGASLDTETGPASQVLSCSCWDDEDKFYVGYVNTATGAGSIIKYDTTITADATFTTFVLSSLSLTAFSVCGMVVIGDYLYVATKHSAGALGRIYKINKTTGVGAAWITSSAV